MTPEQPEALGVALEVIELFDRLDIAYQLGGSYASSVHGVPRQTQDIDLVVEAEEDAVAELLMRLPEGYYRDEQAAREAVRRRGSFNLIHLASGVKLDLFVCGDQPFDREEMARSLEVVLPAAPGRPLRVKSAEDTVLRKLQWFRAGGEVSERQWRDVLGILGSQGRELDSDYLARWAEELGVRDLLERAGGRG